MGRGIRSVLLAAGLIAALAAAACGVEAPAGTPVPTVPVETPVPHDAPVGMPNPAAVFCEEQGGTVSIRTGEDGGQVGYCVFADGTEREEWEYWRESHPVEVGAPSMADWARPTEGPPGTPQIVRQVSVEESQEIARRFVVESATFRFDGLDGSLELESTMAMPCPNCYAFVYAFDSRHAGYGDRTGLMLAQVITPHRASVVVEQGKVTKAVLDDVWDMLAQETVR
ncbi:MAG: DUF333 domain-containing protein [Gemmatimonadetes bacterium]|nr:DUF333 domain-containing protein [Gemmatimonadota bacterium]